MPLVSHAISRPLLHCSLALLGALIALSGQAQTQASAPAPTEKKTVEHDHKHPLPTELAIPHRLESRPSAPHPAEARQRTARLPQK